MAQRYLYNPKYIEEVNEQIYKAIDSSHDEVRIANKDARLENSDDKVIYFENTNRNSLTINNGSKTSLLKEKFYNLFTGLGLVIFILFIIYLFNKILFWLIILILCIFCYYFVTWNFGITKN